jgi:TM2 domain-containing membrane protein YozV
MTNTHSIIVGYVTWIFGFTGSHRFYYGKPISGTIWFFTLGLLGIGWLIDLFLIPGMQNKASQKYRNGKHSYTLSWIFLTFFGYLGIHRFYVGKWISGLVYLCTGGLFLCGVLYDYWNWNDTVSELNVS